MFAFWASWRGYNLAASMQTQDMTDEVTKLPLIQGRSIVAEEVCDDIINFVNHEIPPEFWKNLHVDGALSNATTWQQIIRFSDNCVRRKQFENDIRRRQGKKDDTPISIPAPGIST